MTRKSDAEHEGKEVETDGRFLFWGSHSKVKTSSDTTTIDDLDDDGSVDHTEIEARSRQENDHAAESVRALTTTDEDGPALSFHTRRDPRGRRPRRDRQTAGVADVLPGESAFDGERTVDTEVTLSRAQARAIAAACNAPDSGHWAKLAARVEEYAGDHELMALVLDVPQGVRSPEDFQRLTPHQQDVWLQAVQTASAGDAGNVFDSVAAIELIPDPERKRDAYEQLVLRNHDDKDLEDGDLGAEYLEFAASMKGTVDLSSGTATSTVATDVGVTGALDARKAGGLMTDFVAMLDPERITATLAACYRSGGPGLVQAALAESKLGPIDVYRRLGEDPRQMQALLEATDGTAFGEQLQNVMAAGANAGGPDAADNLVGRALLELAARRPVEVDAASSAPPADANERRGRALARNLDIPGTGTVVAATLIEAQRQGGAAAVNAALAAAGGVSVDDVIAKIEEHGDAGAFQLRVVLGHWANET